MTYAENRSQLIPIEFKSGPSYVKHTTERKQNLIFDTLGGHDQGLVLIVPERTNEKKCDLQWIKTLKWDLERTRNLKNATYCRQKVKNIT